jgi:hypothetical protein
MPISNSDGDPFKPFWGLSGVHLRPKMYPHKFPTVPGPRLLALNQGTTLVVP